MIGRRKDLRQGSPKPYGRYEGRGLPERKAETGKRDLDTKEEVKGRVPPLPERMRRQEETTAPTIPEEGETTEEEEEEPQEDRPQEDRGRSKHRRGGGPPDGGSDKGSDGGGSNGKRGKRGEKERDRDRDSRDGSRGRRDRSGSRDRNGRRKGVGLALKSANSKLLKAPDQLEDVPGFKKWRVAWRAYIISDDAAWRKIVDVIELQWKIVVTERVFWDLMREIGVDSEDEAEEIRERLYQYLVSYTKGSQRTKVDRFDQRDRLRLTDRCTTKV